MRLRGIETLRTRGEVNILISTGRLITGIWDEIDRQISRYPVDELFNYMYQLCLRLYDGNVLNETNI